MSEDETVRVDPQVAEWARALSTAGQQVAALTIEMAGALDRMASRKQTLSRVERDREQRQVAARTKQARAFAEQLAQLAAAIAVEETDAEDRG